MQIIEDSLDQLLKQVAIRTNAVANREEVEKSVREIIANVITDGDQAVKMYEQKFDNVELDSLKVTQQEIDDAYEATDDQVIKALELAKDNITSFHEMEVEDSFIDAKKKGVIRGEKIAPLAAVGLYVLGGTAAYPSSILMNVIPAKIAGVSRIVMVTPPQKDGLNKAVLAAAKIAGVDEIYKVGGAQAIASLAYGTETVPRVDKITGPCNVFVATAKKQVFGQVDIDMIAGPSEIGVIAGSQAVPSQVAADLLSQAEHDKLARPILVTDDRSLAEAVSQEMDRQVDLLPRKEIAKAAMDNEGFIAVVDDIDDAFTLMNAVAPEHLEVQLPDAIEYLNQIKNAGSVFLGFSASEPLGDYLAGPTHILPTGGTARFFSPLGVQDFVKRTQFVSYTREALKKEKDAITTLARVEGLEAHARAIESRFDD
ncbi:histidinol dehydrogenase [Lentilactobacillus parakefiri]|uniref:Histidinol dehydrogenase n=1 Tax=Lentilactobacillus parakefiri TaxID=152332 RepID=A0A269YPQ4_9LACO|nr:histidinol dehydrogenase [Lentilactobacillus parakefiri]PAK87535.1 histidinol dehydrogenase [Lentilactobacillus parakefiri]